MLLYFYINDQCVYILQCTRIAIANEKKGNKKSRESQVDSTGNVGRTEKEKAKKILQHQEGVKHVSTDSLLSGFDMKLAHFEMIINRMRWRVFIFFSLTAFFF